jgi:hypothetical protein
MSCLAFSHAARNFAIACSRVEALPFVTPGVAGVTIRYQPQRSSGRARGVENATDHLAVSDDVIVVVFPLAVGAGGGGAFEGEARITHGPGAE